MDIYVENLYDSGGTLPESGIDTTGLYSAWSLTDEALLGTNDTDDLLVVPGEYLAGEDLTLVLNESTPGVSQKHKWQATVALNGGTADVITAEYTSSGTANTQTQRTITISTTGQIHAVAIAPGDEVSVEFKRIAASGTEDANEIKVYGIAMRVPVETIPIVFTGRVQEIYEDVLDYANEQGGLGYATQARVLRWINKCTKEISKKGYFKTSTLINLTSGDGDIDLTSVFSDHSDIIGCWWEETGREIYAIKTIDEYQLGLQRLPTGDTTLGFYIAENVMYLVPVPDISVTDAIRVWRHYIPAAMTGLIGNCTPPVPEDYDDVYTNYCLWQLALKDRTNVKRIENLQFYKSLFDKSLSNLMEQDTTPGFRLKWYRG